MSRPIFISSSNVRNGLFSVARVSSPAIRDACRRPRHFAHPVHKTRHTSLRAFGGSSATGNETSNNQLRIAIVGGGAAGMTTALHLSPLVAAGLVRGPVDVYESTVVKKPKHHRDSGHTHDGNEGGRQLHPGSGALGRDIGVGIWGTAWWPFLRSIKEGLSIEKSAHGGEGVSSSDHHALEHRIQQQKNRQSYRTLLQDMEACGSYVGDIGYRTPNGSWLVKSELNSLPLGIQDLLDGKDGIDTKTMYSDDPALLFLREKDLLSCLRNAINIEQRLGTVKLHSGVRVDGVDNVNGDLGSLVLRSMKSTLDNGEDDSSLSPQYHLIIAADGLYSPLRSRFAGHHSTHATQTGIESSTRSPPKDTLEYQWEHTEGHREATQVESREYIVFRGNAPKLESSEDDGSGSFQTWGENRSMRFAAVPFRHETEDLDDDENENSGSGHYSKSQSFMSKKKDEEVWFATISDPAFMDAFKASEDGSGVPNAAAQKRLLVEAFAEWHKPIKTLIETTPAEKILYELAISHRHNARPVFDVARIIEFERWQDTTQATEDGGREYAHGGGKIHGRGPILQFIGDSYMTVDPVLAQGFTMAMESGASLVNSIEHTLVHPDAVTSPTTSVYQPKLLSETLRQRYYCRERRLLQLLRSTELVQRMAQPQGTLASVLATWIVRPVAKLSPAVVKKRVFDFLIRYSLGLTGMGEHGIELGLNKTPSNRRL